MKYRIHYQIEGSDKPRTITVDAANPLAAEGEAVKKITRRLPHLNRRYTITRVQPL